MAAAQRCCGLAKIDCHSLTPPGTNLPQFPAASPLAARVAAPAAPMRNGVGSTGSAPPVNMTSAACVSPQPAIGRIVRSASFDVVMILQSPARGDPGHCVWGAAHIHLHAGRTHRNSEGETTSPLPTFHGSTWSPRPSPIDPPAYRGEVARPIRAGPEGGTPRGPLSLL